MAFCETAGVTLAAMPHLCYLSCGHSLTNYLFVAFSAFWDWVGACVVCGSIRRGTKGLFCSNFGRECGPGFDICRRVWCGECYKPHQTDNFHVFVPKDESGFEWRRKPKDALRFKTARDGDHLVTPFQCHLCHFQILTLRNPSESNHKDALLLCCLIRANLDALWSRESSTVDSN
jgi:hypothetical protein